MATLVAVLHSLRGGGRRGRFWLRKLELADCWRTIREEAGVSDSEAALYSDNMGQATLGWIAGCLTIWSSLFAIGNFLYGRTQTTVLLTVVFVVSGSVLLYVVNRLWDQKGAAAH